MNIQHEQTDEDGRFYVEREGKTVAQLFYDKGADGRLLLDHTEVAESLRGTGAGVRLVQAAVAYAREAKVKIVPLCLFAKGIFKRKPDWADVL